MDVQFAFEIGQEVTLRGMLSPFWTQEKNVEVSRALREPPTPAPQKLVVIGRIMEECAGGIQLHYKVRPFCLVLRGWGGESEVSVMRDSFTFAEFELVPFNPPVRGGGA